MKAFRAGHVQAREEGDPLDAKAIKAFMITAMDQDANPGTAGSQASLLQALSRFGRKRHTPERPFSLTMLADPQQQKQPTAGCRFSATIRHCPILSNADHRHGEAFRAGHVRARERRPIDAEAIKAFMITALNQGTDPVTAGNQATLLLVLSRFGRKPKPLNGGSR